MLSVGRHDSDKIYFSTLLSNAIHCYSVVKNKMVHHTCHHQSPPTVLAISSSSVYMVSASAKPPTVLLQDLSSANLPSSISPLIRNHKVTVATFHPAVLDTFLLGFDDGTISIHNASDILSGKRGAFSSETACFSRLHRRNAQVATLDVKNQGTGKLRDIEIPLSSISGITAAAFMESRRCRTVSIGADRKCKIVDFEKGVHVLRTWDVGASGTCLSVLLSPSSSSFAIQRPQPYMGKNSDSYENGSATVQELIAIGRSDGYVALYNSIGLIQHQSLLDPDHLRVIGLQWVVDDGSKLLNSNQGNIEDLGMDKKPPIPDKQRPSVHPDVSIPSQFLDSLRFGSTLSIDPFLNTTKACDKSEEISTTPALQTLLSGPASSTSFETAHSSQSHDKKAGSEASTSTLVLHRNPQHQPRNTLIPRERPNEVDPAKAADTSQESLFETPEQYHFSQQPQKEPAQCEHQSTLSQLLENYNYRPHEKDDDWTTISTLPQEPKHPRAPFHNAVFKSSASVSSWSLNEDASAVCPSIRSHRGSSSSFGQRSVESLPSLRPSPLRPQPANGRLQESESTTLVVQTPLQKGRTLGSFANGSTTSSDHVSCHRRGRYSYTASKTLPRLPLSLGGGIPKDCSGTWKPLLEPSRPLPTSPQDGRRHSSYFVTDSHASAANDKHYSTNTQSIIPKPQTHHSQHRHRRAISEPPCPCNCIIDLELKALRSEVSQLRGEVARALPKPEEEPGKGTGRSRGWMRVGKFMVRMRSSIGGSGSGRGFRRTVRRKVGSGRVSLGGSGSASKGEQGGWK